MWPDCNGNNAYSWLIMDEYNIQQMEIVVTMQPLRKYQSGICGKNDLQMSAYAESVSTVVPCLFTPFQKEARFILNFWSCVWKTKRRTSYTGWNMGSSPWSWDEDKAQTLEAWWFPITPKINKWSPYPALCWQGDSQSFLGPKLCRAHGFPGQKFHITQDFCLIVTRIKESCQNPKIQYAQQSFTDIVHNIYGSNVIFLWIPVDVQSILSSIYLINQPMYLKKLHRLLNSAIL